MKENNPIILALDVQDLNQGLTLLKKLEGLIQKVKIGPGLFFQEGPLLLRQLQEKGFQVFLDLKLHDIPNTVSLAVRSAQKLGIWMLSIHLSGGRKMLKEAVKAASGSLLLAGITVLTSFDDQEIKTIGILSPVVKQIEVLAGLAEETGIRAIVASPLEAACLRKTWGEKMTIITPGIRLLTESKSELSNLKQDDQARVSTPLKAIQAGANYLVIGRPILESSDPRAAVASIFEEIQLERMRK
jgi:orotidine-5'-phosphate decarboxylase